MGNYYIENIDFASETNREMLSICEKNNLGMLNIYKTGKYLCLFGRSDNGAVLNPIADLDNLIKTLNEIKEISEIKDYI